MNEESTRPETRLRDLSQDQLKVLARDTIRRAQASNHLDWRGRVLQEYVRLDSGRLPPPEELQAVLYGRLAIDLGLSGHQVNEMTYDEVARIVSRVMYERRGRLPEERLGSVETERPPGPEPAATSASGVPDRAVFAAYALAKEGKRVSVKAACERAGVDRSHLIKRYPEVVETIKQIGAPDRVPRRGSKTRDGRIEAVEEGED